MTRVSKTEDAQRRSERRKRQRESLRQIREREGISFEPEQGETASITAAVSEDVRTKNVCSLNLRNVEREPHALLVTRTYTSTSTGQAVPAYEKEKNAELDALLAVFAAGRLGTDADPVPEVRTPELPERASPLMRNIWDFFVGVCRVRAWGEFPSAVPFDSGWIAEHLGMGQSDAALMRVYRARTKLEDAKLLVRAEVDESSAVMKGRAGKRAPTHYEPLEPMW